MNNFLEIKKNLEYKKKKLKRMQKKFFINSFRNPENKKVYNISQNIYSFSLLLNSLFFSDSRAYFFMELINVFQDLKIGNITYYSYSQAFTTYCLKMLARNHFININSCERVQGEGNTCNLVDYKSLIDANTNHKNKNYNVAMYDVYFQKICSFIEEDLPFIFRTASTFGIDINLFEPFLKEGKLYLRLKRKILISEIVKGNTFKKLKAQKSEVEQIIIELFDCNSTENVDMEDDDFCLIQKK